tara:strand:- start:30 stop:293 length:264 start_codon:yes stop_codon:yes gene_type:complete
MRLKEYFDIASDTYPEVELADVIKILNRAIEDFSSRTRVVKNSYSASTVAGQRFYTLPDDIIEIISVDVDDEIAPKLIGEPKDRDMT